MHTIRAADFLRAIFGEWDHGYLVLWRGDTKRSRFLSSAELDAADAAVTEAQERHGSSLYFGCGLQGVIGTDGQRGRAAGVCAIPGVWTDLDLAEGAGVKKSKKRYPPREVAEQLLAQMPLPPSLVIHSGGGLQTYWLFHGLLNIHSPGDRERAERLVSSWGAMVAEKLRKLGDYDLDPVHDLARVLRVGGSWNFRHGRRVVLAPGYDLDRLGRYEVDDVERFVPAGAHDKVAVPGVQYDVGDLRIDAGANPPIEKLDVLSTNSPEFRQTWQHKRQLASSSEQELSLAHYAVMAGWSDQEIANLIVAHRRKYEPEKLAKALRPDYLRATIAKARGDKTRDAALRSLNGEVGASPPPSSAKVASNGASEAPSGESAADKRSVLLGQISAVLGIPIKGWLQFGRERPVYSLILDDGTKLKVGSATSVLRNDSVIRSVIFAHAGHVVAPVRGKAWLGLCQALALVAEVEDVDDATDTSTARGAIAGYLDRKGVYDRENRDLACQGGLPFVDDGWLYIHAEGLRRWANIQTATKWEAADMLNAMRRIGFAHRVVAHLGRSGRRTSRSYWVIQSDEFAENLHFAERE